MTLPPLPKDRNWSPETWAAGLDEAVRRDGWSCAQKAESFFATDIYGELGKALTIAHATTLLDAGIVKPVVSEAAVVWGEAYTTFHSQSFVDHEAAIAVIQSALDKARSGQ